jgi:hypothetical protein
MVQGKVANHASALGEAVGGVLDDATFKIIKSASKQLGFGVNNSSKMTRGLG